MVSQRKFSLESEGGPYTSLVSSSLRQLSHEATVTLSGAVHTVQPARRSSVQVSVCTIVLKTVTDRQPSLETRH